MPQYDVTIRRTELITFQVEAADADEARETFWDGDETFSKTVDIEIETVTETAA